MRKPSGIAATPYARTLARERGIDIASVTPTGRHNEVLARDVAGARAQTYRVTPLARRMAQAMGCDLAKIQGTGYMGKITRADIEGFGGGERARMDSVMLDIEDVLKRHNMSGMRKVIAKRMLSSHTEIPCVTHNIEIDVTDLLKLRAQVNAPLSKAERISVNDLVMKAVAITVREQERYRMQLVEGEYVIHDVVNIGMAVGMDDGLLVPVVKHADKKTVFEISREAKTLADKARNNRLSPDDYGCGVITVSNLGMYGTLSFTPIINQPEAAILGVNAALNRLVMLNGAIEERKFMIISLTYDHRIINGTEAAGFVCRVKGLIEQPEQLLK